MDRLTGMEIFVRVVDRGGFTAAAEGSGMSITMVSNHIQALEKRLGAKLLNRTTRRQSLTEIGAAYYAQCIDVLARIESAETSAREMRSQPRGRLRISAPTTLGTHLLVPALAEYLRENTKVEVELILNDRIVDMADEGFDAALRFGKLSDSGLVARPLKSLQRVICASPAYLATYGKPKKPEDLAHHNCLAFHYLQPELAWQFEGNSKQTVNIRGQLTVNHGAALLSAALNDIGIVMLPDYLAEMDIAAGRLTRLFPKYAFARAPLQLVYLPDRHMTPKLKSFIEFVMGRFG